MKKLLSIGLIYSSLLFTSNASAAGWYSSDYFEPIVLCAVVGGVGYATSDEDQAMIGGIGCAAGALIGIGLNSYMKSRIDAVNLSEIYEKNNEIDKINARLADRASKGDVDQNYVLEIEQIEKAQNLPDGSAMSQGKKKSIVAP